jgi:molybdopterin-binding protein
VADLLGVSTDTVRRWADGGRLRSRRTAGGQRVIDATDVARFADEMASPAEAETKTRQSARNRFAGIVTRVKKDAVMAQVEVRCGPHRVVSLMTREAADELDLAPGVVVVANVKSTNVVVEVPAAN